MKTYAQANKPSNGWAHADDESMCAATALMIAEHNCLNPKVVYKWIRKHYRTNWKEVYELRTGIVPYHDLVGPILTDAKSLT